MPTICWFRRDLRLSDHPALVAAVAEARAAGDEVVALYVVDPALWRAAGTPRLAYLAASLRSLDEATGGRLVVRHGRADRVVPAVARQVGASSVHVSAATEPYGRRRDEAVEAALDVPLVRTGCPYAVAPGRLRTGQGGPYQVFTPFRGAWLDHGWHEPAPRPRDVPWAALASDGLPDAPATDVTLPPAGERAARERWHAFVREDLAGYDVDRNRPDLDVTSWMSVHLKHGEIHPRTLLADLADAGRGARGPLADSVATYRSELAWREFHADVLWHHPAAARTSLREVVPQDAWATGPPADRAFAAWTDGRTGYPLVDAGMRQLRAQGWVHNRVRMVVASFLVKDLHLPWQRGAAHFMEWLVDGDVPQNQLNWQWVAGTGRDAAPYFRVFNPVTQARKFDPDGTYVRRWVPELRDVPDRAVHEPWTLPGGLPAGYPERVVDHAHEREVALADHARRAR
ncbi:Deoxyribodipyrimidine photo-lyase [Cellulomonas flavigena DSM 20109]|uniref:Deoxyribodipyrimidine photo-lyase n=1 Tax=Cellulomonas flavigena (strain ATCC 482 / DSM 20109 / BCRC 11376 / JCM 18109 / NBRC 3775 / NCIMB 8073 / NRS 134) TaxID=446466 RepID=D5ULI4_CELFN|nr:deoxyribodipyrimidine photo-lyase [Cellulomonas flavigena]ADG74026.1 Deoxyribodipyrimidine photo-lyase [Cellulomonas flavigena DSM 20109]